MVRKKKDSNIAKKSINSVERQLKILMAEKGIKYNAKVLGTNGSVWFYVQQAIEDVRCSAAEFVDVDFCDLHGLPAPELSCNYTDIQALYLAMVVPELYPDIDDRLLKIPDLPELMFPSLAFQKLKQARLLIEESSEKYSAEISSLVDEVELIVKMLVAGRVRFGKHALPEYTYKSDMVKNAERISGLRKEAVRSSLNYRISQILHRDVQDLVKNVIALLKENQYPCNRDVVERHCIKAFRHKPNAHSVTYAEARETRKKLQDGGESSLQSIDNTELAVYQYMEALLNKHYGEIPVTTFERHLKQVLDEEFLAP